MTNYKKLIAGTVACLGMASFAVSGNTYATEQSVEFDSEVLCQATYTLVKSQIETGGSADTVAETCATDNSIVITSNSIAAAIARVTALEYTEADFSEVTSLSSLAAFTSLQTLGIENTGITTLQGISDITSLTSLSIYGNQISDISAISSLTNLQSFFAGYNQIDDISALAELTELTVVGLAANQISDISLLAGLSNLEELYLFDNQISDISPLVELNRLVTLDLSRNQISDISSLVELNGLTTLYLSDNQISDISSLSNLSGLISLDLSNNQISDVSALAGFDNNFQYLVLSKNHIFDFSPILDMLIPISSGHSNFYADNQTMDVNISSKTYDLPALFQQIRLGDIGDGAVASLLNNNQPFILENATLSEDEKTITVIDPNQPAKITIATQASNTLSGLATADPQNAAAGSAITIYAPGEVPSSSTSTPDTGLFTGETAGAVLRSVGLGLAVVAIVIAPIALAVKRAYARPRLGRNRKK